MDTNGNDKSLNGKAVAGAVDVCRQRHCGSVLSDPLGFAEFDGGRAWHRNSIAEPAEAEMFTRPKSGGGTRLEVVPDFGTSIALQLVAERVREQEPQQAYESWWSTVPLWIRHALVEGMTVIVADVDNYFESIPASGITRALACLGLDEANVEIASRAIREVNAVPDRTGATRIGLPVSHDELVWLIADAVLRPVDDRLSAERVVARHVRWVDDFFVAVHADAVDDALASLRAALAVEGLRLNENKTRVLDSLPDYERKAMTYEHRLVTSLAMVASRGELSGSQQLAFRKLVEGERLATPEHARLWKRTYALAQRQRSPALVSAAFEDLGRYPNAAAQISSYLRSLNWPSGTATRAVDWIACAPTDSQAIALLRALLSAAKPLANAALTGLKEVAKSAAGCMHPYTRVLVHACLTLGQRGVDAGAAQLLLPLASSRHSSLARRIAIELLWLVPEHRAALAELVRRDASRTVRGLAMLPAITGQEVDGGVPADDERATGDLWHGAGSEVKLIWMQARR